MALRLCLAEPVSDSWLGKEGEATLAGAPSPVEGRPPLPALAVAMGVLVATDVAGGIIAVRTGLNTWGEAWGSEALLAAPLPMIFMQVLLAWLTLRLTGRRAAIPAALLALACLVSVASGFFDGGLSNPQLTAGTRVVQAGLLAVTAVVGVLAAGHAVRAWRSTDGWR